MPSTTSASESVDETPPSESDRPDETVLDFPSSWKRDLLPRRGGVEPKKMVLDADAVEAAYQSVLARLQDHITSSLAVDTQGQQPNGR